MLDLLLWWLPGHGGGGSSAPVPAPEPTEPSPVPHTVFGWPVYSDASRVATPTVSGGTWLSALPITNVLSRQFSQVARSVSLVDTTFTVDLRLSRTVGVVCITGHNLSREALVRWRAANTVGTWTVYDSGWRRVYPSTLAPDAVADLTVAATHALATAVTARYWRCDIYDPTNADGYVQVGRVLVSGAVPLRPGMRIGAAFGFQTDTQRFDTEGGASWFLAKPRRRFWNFSVAGTDPHDPTLLHMLYGMDISQQFVFVYDRADPLQYLRTFVGTLRQLGPLEWNEALYADAAFQVLEEL